MHMNLPGMNWINSMPALLPLLGRNSLPARILKILTVVGGGAEGRTNLEAIARFFDFEKVHIYE